MKRFQRSLAFGSFLTFYVMCFYFFVAIMQSFLFGTDPVQVLANCALVALVLLCLFTAVAWGLLTFIDERNSEDRQQRTKEQDRATTHTERDSDLPVHQDDEKQAGKNGTGSDDQGTNAKDDDQKK